MNEHNERRQAALAQLDRALAWAVLSPDDQQAVRRLRQQDTPTIDGVARILEAVRAAERQLVLAASAAVYVGGLAQVEESGSDSPGQRAKPRPVLTAQSAPPGQPAAP
jgi:nucleoside-diphosphate-sugar epimerase